MRVQAYYTARSSNRKTGDIPQQFVGLTRQESQGSCRGCPLLVSSCYAQRGTQMFAHSSVIKAAGTGKDYSLAAAIERRHPKAKYVRFGAIGDPSGLGIRAYRQAEQTVRDAGLGVLSYTHFWRTRGQSLQGHALASCDTWEQVELVTSQGWRAAVHVPSLDKPVGKTASGKTYALCPAQRTNLRVQCNTCGLCDATRQGPEVIVFLDHSRPLVGDGEGVSMERMEEKVAAHEATLGQMNERLGGIETRLTGIEARLDGKASNWLVGAGIAWLSFWMGFLSWLSR